MSSNISGLFPSSQAAADWEDKGGVLFVSTSQRWVRQATRGEMGAFIALDFLLLDCLDQGK